MAQSSLIRQAVLSTVGVLVQGLARFGYSIVIGRALGPDTLAHVNTLISLSIILSLLWPTAAGNAAGSFLARARAAGEDPRPVLRLLLSSFALSSVVLIVAGVVVVVLLPGTSVGDVVSFTVLVLAWSGYILGRGVQLGLGRVPAAALWDVVSAVVSILLLVCVLLLDLPSVLILPLAAGYALFAAAAWFGALAETRQPAPEGHDATGAVPVPAPTTATTGAILRFIGWNSAGLLATNGLIQFAMVFAFLTSDARDAGMFAAAMALATPASMLAQAVSQALIPRFSEWVHADPDGAVARYRPVLGIMVGVLSAAFGAVAALADLIVPVLYGPGFEDAVGYLRLLLLGVFLFSVGVIASSFLITSGRAVSSAVAAGAGTGCGLVVMLVAASAVGGSAASGWGVAVGSAVTVVVVVVISLTGVVKPDGRAARR